MSGAFGFEFGFPVEGIRVGLGDLTFQVETSLALFLQLNADRLQFDFDRVQRAFQGRTALWE